MRLPLLLVDPPLDPSGDEARSALRRELLKPEYHDTDVLGRVLDWIDHALDQTVDRATSAPPLSTFAAIVAFLLLGLGLAWLLSRVRRTSRLAGARGPVVEDRTVTAAELRAAAERALAAGRHGDAVVEGFRALTVRQVERGWIDDRPGATAHEVALSLAAAHPDQERRVAAAAGLFDEVRYGDRPANGDQAAEVLALDDALAGVRR
ncbi:DUF4129 domain-containing protein [Nocardioides sp. MAH-18]|uniref:DUF4129 domain-containing protein n=1 Tax=Nocardioides agri TaxID=2682843 RepID=A0A6L6XPL0_9ACTN|nr:MULTISPECIES: DUF4129 domain-containing protein [unclassified Nocardioides]MBA2954353.1 DUF4129 domain-containing protein [Nocardioides sp. CGMCC 1.13656]MVQ49214.1 DUF4129 domain-containing protein [Nocardioides sp. MAH-18]